MSAGRQQLRIPGREILRQVVAAYQPFRTEIRERQTRVLILRFTTTDPATSWATRMQASAVSARQKVAVFGALGAQPEEVVVPDTVSAADFVDHLEAGNADPRVAAVIVQTPTPARLSAELNRLDPGKDIDALGLRSSRPACATADGIARLAAPFLDPGTVVVVVGSRGFVGSGVVELLGRRGHTVLGLDAGDDLRRVREADVVISTTGRAGLLTADHLHDGHRLVIDSGFVPGPDGPVGDVHPSARHLPQAITPVPGGVGPVEMATLAERLVIQQVAPGLASWRYIGPSGGEERPLTTAARDVQALRSPAPDIAAAGIAAKALGSAQPRPRQNRVEPTAPRHQPADPPRREPGRRR